MALLGSTQIDYADSISDCQKDHWSKVIRKQFRLAKIFMRFQANSRDELINFLNQNPSVLVLGVDETLKILEDRALMHWAGAPRLKKDRLDHIFVLCAKIVTNKTPSNDVCRKNMFNCFQYSFVFLFLLA